MSLVLLVFGLFLLLNGFFGKNGALKVLQGQIPLKAAGNAIGGAVLVGAVIMFLVIDFLRGSTNSKVIGMIGSWIGQVFEGQNIVVSLIGVALTIFGAVVIWVGLFGDVGAMNVLKGSVELQKSLVSIGGAILVAGIVVFFAKDLASENSTLVPIISGWINQLMVPSADGIFSLPTPIP